MAGRWVSGRDLADALDELSVEADVAYADGQGKLDELEDELFRLDRVVAAERGLADKLERPQPSRWQPGRSCCAVCCEGKADPVTVRLAERAVDGRGRNFAAALRVLPGRGRGPAQRQHRDRPGGDRPDRGERSRLAEALGRQYGRQIQLNVIVDPDVSAASGWTSATK